eukprot:498646-Pelagomonas_calceolata.AAC.4
MIITRCISVHPDPLFHLPCDARTFTLASSNKISKLVHTPPFLPAMASSELLLFELPVTSKRLDLCNHQNDLEAGGHQLQPSPASIPAWCTSLSHARVCTPVVPSGTHQELLQRTSFPARMTSGAV